MYKVELRSNGEVKRPELGLNPTLQEALCARAPSGIGSLRNALTWSAVGAGIVGRINIGDAPRSRAVQLPVDLSVSVAEQRLAWCHDGHAALRQSCSGVRVELLTMCEMQRAAQHRDALIGWMLMRQDRNPSGSRLKVNGSAALRSLSMTVISAGAAIDPMGPESSASGVNIIWPR